jgi:transmembrane sensor
MTEPQFNSEKSDHFDIEDVAAAWLVKRDRGFSPSDASRFSAWLSASEAHSAAWERAIQLWDGFDDEPDLLLEGMRRAALSARPGLRPQFRNALIAFSAIAATVLIAVFGWRGLAGKFGSAGNPQQTLASAELHPDIATAIGSQSTTTLADGSRVTLDTNSAIKVAYTAGRREVYLLRGQAFFTVAPNPKRPFSVNAEGREITALGTAFNVRLGPQALSVVLARGHVAITQHTASGRVDLTPGLMFKAGLSQPGVVSKVDLDQALAWRTGYLEFHDEPLASAVTEMERYGGGHVTFGDAALGALQVNGRFRAGDPVRFAQVLSDIYPVRVIPRIDGVELARR